MPTPDFNSGSWKVFNDTTAPPTLVETHRNPKDAQRAALILSAHELKNDRVANFRVDPVIIIPLRLDELGLPSWAYRILVAGLIEEQTEEAVTKDTRLKATIGERRGR